MAILHKVREKRTLKKVSLVRRVPTVLLMNYSFPQEHHTEMNNPKVTNVVLGNRDIYCKLPIDNLSFLLKHVKSASLYGITGFSICGLKTDHYAHNKAI